MEVKIGNGHGKWEIEVESEIRKWTLDVKVENRSGSKN
jgi:hypothetical protein